MRNIFLIILLSTSVNTFAYNYDVCSVLKKSCVSFVELTTEENSIKRNKRKRACMRLKRNCNQDLDAILGHEQNR